MSSEASTATSILPAADDGQLFCYRHPARPTLISCGRCEQPICTGCAMQGPVGFRCRSCGTPARDPLTALSARQFAAGAGIGLAAGVVTGAASAIGFLGLCVALIAGRMAADRAHRATGYKQGPRLLLVVVGGIVAGTFIGYGLFFGGLFWPVIAFYAATTVQDLSVSLQIGGWAVFAAAVACLAAYWRLR